MPAKTTLWTLILALALPVAALAADPQATAEDAPPTPVSETTGQALEDLLLNREHYFYSSFGRRDPFGSLIKGHYSKAQDGDLLDVGELELKGVVWGDNDKFAVVEDKRGHSHILREGDRVVNGRVTRISESSLSVVHYFFGESTTVTIYMTEGEGSYEAP